MPFIARRASVKTILRTVYLLNTAVEGSLPIVKALTLTADSLQYPTMRDALRGIVDGLRRGLTLSEAVKPYRAYLGDELAAAFSAGDVTGKFDDTLSIMLDIYEYRLRARRMIAQQLAYPFFILIFATVLLPYLKGFWMTTDDDYTLHYIIGLREEAAFFAACWIVTIVVASVRPLRRGAGYLLLWIPPLGALLRRFALARFFDGLALLLTVGHPNARAVQYAIPFAGNVRTEHHLERVIRPLRDGSTLYAAFNSTGIVSQFVLDQIKTAEFVGNIEGGLHQCAVQLTSGTRHVVDTAISLIEFTFFVGIFLFLLLSSL